jgi:C1A family cysteine protease
VNTPLGSSDWRPSGKQTSVKDQGSCGSCWSFSANEALESVYAIEHGQLLDLSEQELVDCSGSFGNHGCNGGWMYWAFDYVKSKGGLALESEYPYKARDQTCTANLSVRHAPVSGYSKVSASEKALESAIDAHPVAVAVDASNWSFYKGGDFSNCASNLNHAVVASGYDTDHWIVRNSWGGRWGESGYIYLKKGNTCGVENAAYVPMA